MSEICSRADRTHTHAHEILHHIGLDMGDLEHYDGILDVGAGLCELGFVAGQQGHDVHSIDNETHIGLEDEVDISRFSHCVPYTKTESTTLPFEDNRFDLAICHESPPIFGVNGIKNIQLCINEILRVTRKEMRIFPTGLISTFVVGYRIPQEKKERIYTPEFFRAVQNKSRDLLKTLCPNIEFHSVGHEEYCVVRK